VKANAKKREKVVHNGLRPEGRAATWRLGLSSIDRAKEHTSKRKGEKRGRMMALDEARPEDFYTRVPRIMTSKFKSETIGRNKG
jgi:hypothetical protein